MSEGGNGTRAARPNRGQEISEDSLQLSLADPPANVENCDCELERIHYQARVDAFIERLKDDASARAGSIPPFATSSMDSWNFCR
jgi:hypothetical protein